MKYFIIILLYISFLYSSPLQDAINKASAYSTIKLSNAVYNGSIIINKPLTILGNNTTIKGDKVGDVIKILSDKVVLKNLTIINSGNRVENLNSAISLTKANYCKIDNCIIKNCLYGINLAISNHNIISNNQISSFDYLPLSQKGGGVKIWYSNHNIIKNNIIKDVKNNVINFSKNNQFINNQFYNSMFALHLSNSSDIKILNNVFKYNSSAIVSMCVMNLIINNNDILSSKGAAGIGIVLDNGKNIKIQHNNIKYNAKAFYIDSTSKEKGIQRTLVYNNIAYNKEVFHFHQAIKNNIIQYNNIYGNLDDVIKDTPGTYDPKNNIAYNYWDNYKGFDKNNDNIGDNPYMVYQYADKLWHYNHKVKFFYGSPIMSLLNFMSNLAPFIEPNLLFIDKKPLIQKNKFD